MKFVAHTLGLLAVLVHLDLAYAASAIQNLITLAGTTGSSPPLRILPLGDSITWGYDSTDRNGYRLPLLLSLESSNFTEAPPSVVYLGTQFWGYMSNNANEGYPGYTISEIASKVNTSGALLMNPNLILLLAGTNDINLGLATGAPERYDSLLNLLMTACPLATILVGLIPPNANTAVEPSLVTFNAALATRVAEGQSRGQNLWPVNMSQALSVGDLEDGLHPTDYGYTLMANAWFEGIRDVLARNWVVDVGTTGGSSSGTSSSPSASKTSTPTATATHGATTATGSATGMSTASAGATPSSTGESKTSGTRSSADSLLLSGWMGLAISGLGLMMSL